MWSCVKGFKVTILRTRNMCIYIYISIILLCTYVYMCIHMHTCIYIYMYEYIQTYVHTSDLLSLLLERAVRSSQFAVQGQGQGL